MTLGADAVFAGYTIVRMLGSGGMGEVYLAQHPRLPRTEAFKLLKPEISLDGTQVGIVCQTIGDTRRNSGYGASDLWYQITSGAYIPSVYMTTGTEGFPQC